MHWTEHTCKAFTLSYDDGVESDLHLLELLQTYGVKCTFNLNSGLGAENCWDYQGFPVRRLDLAANIHRYAGHEIAVHGSRHLDPTQLSAGELEAEFTADKAALTKLCGTEPVGAAYAYGAYNDCVVEKLRSIGIRYCRTVEPSHAFAPQSDLLRFRPTCHHKDEALMPLLERFLALPDEGTPQIFYLWGHSYEFDGDGNWDVLERVLERVAGRKDVFLGTNREVLL